MMKPATFLPVLNVLGCLALVALAVAQWRKEYALGEQIHRLEARLQSSDHELAEAAKRQAALENDIAQLKESIEATAAARKEAEDKLAAALAGQQQQAEGIASSAQQQIEAWQKAVAERDARIRELNEDLAATRKRLDQAIARLKAAGAR